MVGVAVGVEDRIDLTNVFAQQLLAQVGCRVDEDILAAVTQQGTATGAVVVRVVRSADRAVAANDRNSGTGS